MSRNLIWIALISILSPALARAELSVSSPDGQVVIHVDLLAGGVPSYSIDYGGKPMILSSRLGFSPDLLSGFSITSSAQRESHSTWKPVNGERQVIADDYRELAIDLTQSNGKQIRLTCRASNEGAAFRYTFAQATHLSAERSEFHFPPGSNGWEEHGTEGEYRHVALNDIEPWCERPLTIEYADGDFASLTEADNERFPRMLISRSDQADTLVSALGGNSDAGAGRGDPSPNASDVTALSGESSPWRVLIVGHRPGDLLEHNDLIRSLCPPCALSDTSWIVPGKAMRDVRLTTDNSKKIIDFAAEGGLQYVLLDDRWYGSEEPDVGDATIVRKHDLNIPDIIQYGRSKHIGLWLYVDRRQIKTQRDKLFALYEKWGVVGVKIGFVDVGPASETAWITETIQHAADRHLMLDIHDGYRDTGYARTYPNLLTVEGVRGNEHHPTATHNCTLPFTRFVGGPADYTICYMDGRSQTTHGQQLAMSIVYFSPFEMLYWYDRPEQVQGRPELELFRHVPTTWDDTHVIDGQIGQFAVVARRKGDDWFAGAMTGDKERDITLPVSFLTANKRYIAHVYADSTKAGDVKMTTQPCASTDVLHLPLQPHGGAAVWFEAEKR